MRASAWALGALALGLAACTRLPEIEAGECGNGVIERGEDCDTFGDDAGVTCRPKGSVGECHLDCSPNASGQRSCPAGWGCDLGSICRRPTGLFDPPREFEVGTAASLASADFDGDGRFDVLSSEAPDPFGVTRIKFHYFDEQGALDDTRPFPHLLLSPVITHMKGDVPADVVFTDSRVGVLLGRADRSWIPETFSSYRVTGTAVRTLTLRDALVDGVSGFVVFADFDRGPGVYVPQDFPRLIGALPSPIDTLVGDPVGGQVIEGAPCKQMLIAERGEDHLTMLDACVESPDGSIVWRPEVLSSIVALDPPERITHAPQVVDINGDGHQDVIVGSADRMFVAYGDGQALATAVPYEVASGDAGVTNLPMPLAAGDVTGDGRVDFVFSDGLWLSSPSSVPGSSEYTPAFGPLARWTVAAIADFNGNGHPDIVAATADRPGLSFYNGTGSSDLTFFSLATSRPVQRLAVGDFDGDLIEDLAFVQDGRIDRSEAQVMIAFGAPSGPPLAPVAVARLTNVEQMATYREAMLSHLLIASSETTEAGSTGVLTLLTGSGDRIPVALYELTTFASDNSVNGSSAARVLAGAFTSSAPGDVLALAFSGEPSDSALEFWLLPALGSSTGTPVRLSGGLPADVRTVFADRRGLSVAGANADVDGDGRDEAILAAPAQDAEHCALVVLAVEPDRVSVRSEAVVAEPCAHIEIAAVDADADSHVDVAWLTGRADSSERQLSILWNDGAGGFSSERRSVISDRSVSPQAFALLPANPARGTSVAYATPSTLELVGIDPATREPGAPVTLFPLSGCTGMTAADLNGDGAIDLVAAVGGNLNVFEASLEPL